MIRAVLLDIEGTTTSLAFVRETLFPFARRHLRAFLKRHDRDPAVRALMDDVVRIAGNETPETNGNIDPVAQMESWIEADRKETPLKAVQGLIWAEAYEAGAFVAHVYDDVPGALRAWRRHGLRLFVFSSGSVLAQQALFAHTAGGDLRSLFEGWFDTNVGSKVDPRSYQAISRQIDVPGHEILFLSDTSVELNAARSAGFQTTAIQRRPDPLNGHAAAPDLEAVVIADRTPESAAGRSVLDRKNDVVALARWCHDRRWADATSGNFSIRVDSDRIVVSASGCDKASLGPTDVVLVNTAGVALESGVPSAETPLHLALYRASAGTVVVAHTHSIAATVISRHSGTCGELRIQGYELAKAFPGIVSHESVVTVPILENSQDMKALAATIAARLATGTGAAAPAYLVKGHGLTTWGPDARTVRLQLEALEFLMACMLAERSVAIRS